MLRRQAELSAEEARKVLGTFACTVASRPRHVRAELEARFKRVDESLRDPATDPVKP
jgi:hypothetical protein